MDKYFARGTFGVKLTHDGPIVAESPDDRSSRVTDVSRKTRNGYRKYSATRERSFQKRGRN